MQELELQLHEQYAHNNNSYFSSIVVLISALVTALGVYGYVFVRTKDDWAKSWDNYFSTQLDKFSLDALLLTGLVAIFVLTLCFHICVYQGSAQRKEQFIIDFIRKKYYNIKTIDNKPFDKIPFPKGYHPCNKNRRTFVQGLYLVFTYYIVIAQIMIIISLLLRLHEFSFSPSAIYNCEKIYHIPGNISILLIFMGMVAELCYYLHRFRKYSKMNSNYPLPEPKEETNKKSKFKQCHLGEGAIIDNQNSESNKQQ